MLQNVAYLFGHRLLIMLYQQETEIGLFQDGPQSKIEKKIHFHRPESIPLICHLPPPHFLISSYLLSSIFVTGCQLMQKTKNHFPATEKYSQLGDIYFQVIASSDNNFLAGVVKTV
jgi:hypothetical protein